MSPTGVDVETTIAPGTVVGARRVSGQVRLTRWLARVSGAAFLLPIAAVLILLFVIPLGQSIYYSFTNFSGYSPSKAFVGLRNYISVFADPSMTSALVFTVLYTVGTVVVVTVVAIPLAVIFNRKFTGKKFVRAILFFPAVPSVAILGLVWAFILSPLPSGMVNGVLNQLFGTAPVPWLSQGTLARVSVICVAVWAQTGWHSFLYLAYLQSIPSDYYEAARLDGASPRQQFFHVTLPLLRPAIIISQLLLTTAGLKVYDLPFTLTNGGPGYSTFTITQAILQNGLTQGRVGPASALSVLFMLFVLVIVVGQLAMSRRMEGRM